MSLNLSLNNHRKADFQIAKEILKPEIITSSGIKELDDLVGGFKSGEITYIDGDSNIISKIASQICVNSYKSFKSDIIYLDAGVCADPYIISFYAKKMEVDSQDLLKHIHISRAFTVHQLTTLLQNTIEPIIIRYKPQTLIIDKFPVLYLDSDVDSKESQALLRSNIHKIKELTIKYNLITIFTNLDRKMISNNRNVRKILYENVDEIVLMKKKELATDVRLLKKDKRTMILHLQKGQKRLQNFGMVM